MKKEQSIQSVQFNFVMNFILTLSSIIFPLVTFPYVSRILTPAGTGRVSFVTGVVANFVMLGMMGIPTYGIRACAKVRDDRDKLAKTVQEILIINSAAMALSLVLYLMAVMLVPQFAADRTLFIVNISVLVFNVLGVDWLYRALERYQYITMRSVAFKFIALVLMFLFVKQSDDYVIYGIILIFASVGSNVMNFLNLLKIIRFKRFEHLSFRPHMRPILNFFMMSIATTIYTSLDTVMLGLMSGNVETGYYDASIKIKLILVNLVTSLGAVLLPRLSFYVEQQRHEEFRTITTKAFRFVLVSALPLTLYFILFAKESILFLSGSAFEGAIVPMQFIMPTLLFIGLSNLLGIQILVPQQREKEVLYSVSLGAITNLIVNALLIPSLGAVGAALGTLIAELVVLLYQAYVLRDFLNEIIRQAEYWKLGVALLIAGVMTLGMTQWITISSLFVLLVVTSVVFFAVYGCVLLGLKESFVIEMFNKFVRRR